MLIADGFVGLVLLCVWVFCVFEAITADPAAVRNLPKLLWVILVIVLLDVGSLLWLLAGRPRGPVRSLPYKGNTGVPPEYDRPGRATAGNPDDDAAFLAQLKARAEQQRKAAAEQARRLREEETPPPV
jgi:hypothetical protein